MTEINRNATVTGADGNGKCGETRTSRSIRFADTEWKSVEKAASKRDVSPGEFVRDAALAMAQGDGAAVQGTLPPGLVSLMESTYRGVFLLATLKREEMFREGRHEELDRMLEDARRSQSELFSGA